MMQLDLFDAPPAARRTDPDTSREAANEITESGARGRMVRLAVRLVAQYPGRTSNELDRLAERPDGAIRKRLNDGRRLGLLRVGVERECTVTGRRCQTWWPAHGEAAQ